MTNITCKHTKDERVSFRVTRSNKKKLKKLAERSGLALGDYLVKKGLDEKCFNEAKIYYITCLQNIANEIQDTYGNNEIVTFLQNGIDNLWKQ